MSSTGCLDKWTRSRELPVFRILWSCTALSVIASVLLVWAPAETAAAQVAARKRHRPNVLIFVTDDQRIGTLKHMPATRRLIGRKGMTFRNAFATTPLCCPARTSIMTGRYAHNHHVR
jgi:Sulfatase